MAVFKCKMCGGTIEFEKGATVGVCDSCGTKQTLPRLDDDRRANLYDRANHFRRNNDFDKAMGIYEQILAEDNSDAEAYWSLVLCRYGIEYVEDPATHERVPTVNRAQYTSIFADEDYKSALKYADSYQRLLYEEEAKAIDEIQKGILEISNKEDPFDVFICYKETDASGRRTQDSVLATDLYHQLTQEGFKVFFARITLEDKLGTAYEPYIFAALNSAKVMVVLGTKPEYFNAVWVKNEWSRYLGLVQKSGGKKVLIPAYRDMDPYDLPEEFSHLQAQDMSKLGFMQDLIRGIKKIAAQDTPKTTTTVKETVTVSAPAGNTSALLERAFMFLEDGDWKSADEYCEKVLDIDPKCARAYLGKLMAELNVRTQGGLKDCPADFGDKNNYQKVMRFGDDALKDELKSDITYINERNETKRKTDIYNTAFAAMNRACTEVDFKQAAREFQRIRGFKDADMFAEKCLNKAEDARKDAIYADASSKMTATAKIADYEKAIEIFQTIPGWKDTNEQISACKSKIEEIKAKEEAARKEAERLAEEQRIAAEKAAKKRKKIIAIAATTVCACIAFIIVLTQVIIPNKNYNAAVALMDAGQYEEAITAFEAMNGYKDSTEQITECRYLHAVTLMDAGQYEEAIAAFEAMNGYKDSAEKAADIYAAYKQVALRTAEVGDYVYFGSYEQDNDTSNGKEYVEWLVLAKEDNKILVISKYALDCQPYNTDWESVTWATCTLRKWLNSEFINAAFTADEQKKIQETTVTADKNPKYDTDPGRDTTDKIFLLSIDEANEYFDSDAKRMCAPSAYAKAQGAYSSSDYEVDGEATCWWWLRSPGINQNYPAIVYYGGGVLSAGNYVLNVSECVRPAFWINLDS